MNIEDRYRKAVEYIDGELAQLDSFVRALTGHSDVQLEAQRLQRWKYEVARVLSDLINPEEGALLSKEGPGFPVHNPDDVRAEANIYRAHLEALKEDMWKSPERVLSRLDPGQGVAPPNAPSRPTIFVVHGHDELNLRRLSELLEKRWKLDPLVMRWEAGKGRTLIEKFEQEAQKAAFAFALMTPDDLVKVAEGGYAQARPNAVFELGWFYGRLGRSNVCILMKKGTQIHSDLDGISRIQFEETVEEKVLDIERELNAARILKTE